MFVKQRKNVFVKLLTLAAKKRVKSRRAFIFTLDALLALALVSSLFALFALTALPPGRNEKFFELEQLGFDSLALRYDALQPIEVSDADFATLTGLHRSSSLPTGAALVARARFYAYPALCGCSPPSCSVERSASCLGASDAGLGVFGANYSDVWVTP